MPCGPWITGWCRACPREDRGTPGCQAVLVLPWLLRKLDSFDFLPVDGLGYLP